jgi:hypothetical protein
MNALLWERIMGANECAEHAGSEYTPLTVDEKKWCMISKFRIDELWLFICCYQPRWE